MAGKTQENPAVERQNRAEELVAQVFDLIPHVKELGMETVHFTRGMAIMRLPYDGKLVGNPETGVLHGGVVTTLIDTVAGMAALTAPEVPRRCATLDLRIDYLRPATPHLDVYARAEVYKLTRDIAFVNAIAYQDDTQDPVASSTGTFMFVGKVPSEDGET